MNIVKYQDVKKLLNDICNIKTGDIDKISKKLIKEKSDVSDLRDYVLKDSLVHRIYFQVSMRLLSNNEERLNFIENNLDLLRDWWHVDQLIQFFDKPLDFDLIYKFSSKYINSKDAYTRRISYVLFISGLQKDRDNAVKILDLLKNDYEYMVCMAEAWLLCELAIYNFDLIMEYLDNCDLKYNITGKAVQKMCDSFRITSEQKLIVKSKRSKLKNSGV